MLPDALIFALIMAMAAGAALAWVRWQNPVDAMIAAAIVVIALAAAGAAILE